MTKSGISLAMGALLILFPCRATLIRGFSASFASRQRIGGRMIPSSAFATPIRHNNFLYSNYATYNNVMESRSRSHSRSMTLANSRLRCRLLSTITDDSESKTAPIPMTLLAGFLGSGKTTTLKNLLENREGVRIGIIVNDVASVNIDSKLLSNPSDVYGGDGTVELQNGCACCSLSDELLDSVQQLTEMGTRELDAIVVELSGVADPVAVRKNWEQASTTNHPAAKIAQIKRVVTLVDSSTFGTDWMTWDTSLDRENWVDKGEECNTARNVPELLAEQVEAADLLVINKIDLAGKTQVETATAVAKGLNQNASIFQVEFGNVSPLDVLGDSLAKDDPFATPTATDPDDMDEVAAQEHTHAHSEHDHQSSATVDCTQPDCTDESHSHSHSHSHDKETSCSEPNCTDESHSHSHSHDNDATCSDPDCTDDSHSHSHSHSHNTSTDKLGITNFVYTSDRPFDALRLLSLLNDWPIPIKEELDLGQLARAAQDGVDMSETTILPGQEPEIVKSPFVGVLRSKGFCWLAPTKWSGSNEDSWRHDTAMFWSHAGKHFGISTAGKWWGTVSKEQMKGYFVNNEKEYERILKEDFVSEEWGDRRQELVFIGTGIEEDTIRSALDECLCDDEEMENYRMELKNTMTTRFVEGGD